MSSRLDRTNELLTQLVNSKHNLADTLVAKGEEAEFSEPFDDLVQKAADYIPKTYILVDENENELVATLVEQETLIDATEDDVRAGKTFVSELGIKMGTKVIPAYHTTEARKVIPAGSQFSIHLPNQDAFNFTRLQAIICEFNTSMDDSVSASMVVINESIYNVASVDSLSNIAKDSTTKTIDFGITNNTDKPFVIRYFSYKEI